MNDKEPAVPPTPQRSAEIDAAYAVYDERPLDELDAWGDLASFHAAAGASRAD